MRGLADAIQGPGALEALAVLAFHKTSWAPGTIEPLAHALATGAAPSLRSLDLGEPGKYSDSDVKALAAMLQARAQHPACHGLEKIKTSSYGLYECSEASHGGAAAVRDRA